ncbi:hypothetical protein [Pollutimonas bauzanensis]|uniref:Secreted protein n=1 Tax=Pollutimonas bauzanensis TaxID=658167 RepID=A0A1M5ZWU5_9BURK|nr:hypothetical protein [Pollutimonas bauzanensis]SHI28682.1 hypothetical protein SAMN04488135_1203 [Pollutimonas bauzanensis]
MKLRQLTLVATVLAAAGIGSSALAGTPGITGKYSGTYDPLEIYNLEGSPPGPVLKGLGNAPGTWEFDFNNRCATFSNGTVNAQPPLVGSFGYTVGNYFRGASATFPIDDHGDGYYTVYYRFQANNPGFGNPFGFVSSTLEVTQAGGPTGPLTIATIDHEATATGADGVVGTSIPAGYGFPYLAERNWQGTAYLDPAVSITCP